MKANTLKTVNLAFLVTMLYASSSQATETTMKNNEIVEAASENIQDLLSAGQMKLYNLDRNDAIRLAAAKLLRNNEISYKIYTDIELNFKSIREDFCEIKSIAHKQVWLQEYFSPLTAVNVILSEDFKNGAKLCNQIVDRIDTISTIAPDLQVTEFRELRDHLILLAAQLLKLAQS